MIKTKWVYRNKQDQDKIIVRNKARLIAQGYTQVEGLDFRETYAPVLTKRKSFEGYKKDIEVLEAYTKC